MKKIVKKVMIEKHVYSNGKTAYTINTENFDDRDELIGFLGRVQADIMEPSLLEDDEKKKHPDYTG